MFIEVEQQNGFKVSEWYHRGRLECPRRIRIGVNHMEQSFELSGVHCMHCVARVKKAVEPLCEKVEVTLSPAIAVVTVKEPLKIEDVNAALAKAGDYSATPLN